MKRILFFIGFFLIAQITFAQSPSLKTAVDKTQILIGEQLQYSVEATFPINTYQLNWFNVPDSFSHFEIVIRGKIDTAEKNGMLVCRQTLTITSFDSGINTIPSLPIKLDSQNDDTTINLFTDSISINVSFSPMDSTQTFHDIKSIIEVKDEIPLWIWIGGGALLILLIVLIIYLIKYFKRRKKEVPLFKSKLSPYDEAMHSMESIRKESLLSKGEIKQYHTSLTGIFNRYLSRKLEKNLLNKTSSEILILLNDTLLSKENTSIVAANLRMTDAVKFAKYTPPVSESEAELVNTKKAIDQIEKLILTDIHPDAK